MFTTRYGQNATFQITPHVDANKVNLIVTYSYGDSASEQASHTYTILAANALAGEVRQLIEGVQDKQVMRAIAREWGKE